MQTWEQHTDYNLGSLDGDLAARAGAEPRIPNSVSPAYCDGYMDGYNAYKNYKCTEPYGT